MLEARGYGLEDLAIECSQHEWWLMLALNYPPDEPRNLTDIERRWSRSKLIRLSVWVPGKRRREIGEAEATLHPSMNPRFVCDQLARAARGRLQLRGHVAPLRPPDPPPLDA